MHRFAVHMLSPQCLILVAMLKSGILKNLKAGAGKTQKGEQSMLYTNVTTKFYTDPSGNPATSKYFVCENGTVRAKVAANKMYAAIDRNICYVDQAARDLFGAGYKGKTATYSSSTEEVTMTWKKSESSDKTVIGVLSNTTTNNRVYEFQCDSSGNITWRHMGSKITDSYNPGETGITETQVDTKAASYMNSAETQITSTCDGVSIT